MTTTTFEYRALDLAGKKQSGTLQAASKPEAVRKVAALNLTPLSVRQLASVATRSRRRGKRVSGKELAHFTDQLAVLISARIPVADGLRSIAEQEKPGHFRTILEDLAERITAGESIAAAMSVHEDNFGEVYVETVRAAESSGNLNKVLDHLSGMLERGQEATRQVWGALMYPICIVGVLAIAVLFLVGFIVPKFAKMFQQRGADLPGLTKALLAMGNSIHSYWWLYLIVAALIAFALKWFWGTPTGSRVTDRVLHKIPVVRSLLFGLAISRFARVFGITLSSGLGLMECLTMAGKASGRPMLVRDVDAMVEQVRVGGRLSEVLGRCTYFTPFTTRMLIAGEQSAEIPRMCDIIARHYERETSQTTKSLGTVIEPVLIVLIASVVLVIALAIFLPMWDMLKLVG